MKKNNILVIVTDQLTWRALPAYGNTYARTPNIDRIAEHAVIYDECYTPCPLCQPGAHFFLVRNLSPRNRSSVQWKKLSCTGPGFFRPYSGQLLF